MDLKEKMESFSGCAHNFALEDTENERNGTTVEHCVRLSDALTIAREYAEEMQLKVSAYEHALMALVNDGDRHLCLVEAYKDNPESVELHKRKAKAREAVKKMYEGMK